MPKTYIIGDIHGALKALQQVIGRVGVRQKDRLIFLGDYVDGWSQSRQVIDYLIELDRQHDCLFLKGNHDAWCEEWLKGEIRDLSWLVHGGEATLKSYAGITPEQRCRHIAFLNRMQLYYEDRNRHLFIHAGFTSMRGPSNERNSTSYFWDRTLWETALAVDDRINIGSDRYPQRLLLYDEIYIGHTPTTNYGMEVPMKACNVWNVDTGAAFRGRLSVMDIDTKQYWQSEPVWLLYAGEKGRNK